MNARGAVVQIAPYVRRLLDDEHVQDEVRELILDARRGAARAQRVGPERAMTDKRLRRHMAAGATAATQIYKAFNEPKPPKRRRLNPKTNPHRPMPSSPTASSRRSPPVSRNARGRPAVTTFTPTNGRSFTASASTT